MKKILKRKGFTLVECIVAIAIFALMSALVMQILALAIRQYKNNHHVETDLDGQIEKIIAMDNSLLERETIDLALKFVDKNNGVAGNVEVADVTVYKNPDTEDGTRLELNTFDATIIPDNAGNKNNQGGSMITEDVHCYGTKGIDSISITSSKKELDDGNVQVTLNVSVEDGKNVLCKNLSNAFKLSLPGYAKDIIVTPLGSNTNYLRMSSSSSGVSYRIYPKSLSDTADPEVNVTFILSQEEYNSRYGSSGKFFGAKDPNFKEGTITFKDTDVPGIYRAS